jgi:hypothetical protein
MSETSESNPRSTLQVAFGFFLGILLCIGCWFLSVLAGAALGLQHAWMFPLLNAIALVVSGAVALRRANQSSYPEGVLIAISVAFVLNVVIFAAALSGHME